MLYLIVNEIYTEIIHRVRNIKKKSSEGAKNVKCKICATDESSKTYMKSKRLCDRQMFNLKLIH